MMPELGKYAGAVLSSYGISLALLLLLIIVSVRRARRMRRELEEVEKRIRRNG